MSHEGVARGLTGGRCYLDARLEVDVVDTTEDCSGNLGAERVPHTVLDLLTILALQNAPAVRDMSSNSHPEGTNERVAEPTMCEGPMRAWL